jgi:aspartyl-tRNA(Asn)/glutamyl-tRNA(Gln) amidotransferase subunit A
VSDAFELRRSIVAREQTVERSIERTLAAIDARNGELNALLVVDRERALARARELDREITLVAEPGPLFGVPFVIKANMCLHGRETNCASRVLAGYRAPYTATAVQRLLDAGAICVGIANMDEFAMGSSGENSAFGAIRNPWDLSRTPGGSSSGSTVAVAAGLVPFALGSDTGGSVRQPAALCGVCGIKPTYGRVSRYGLIAFGSSLDCVGVLARSAREVELVLGVISGHDAHDSTSLPLPPLEPERDASDLAGLRVGVPREHFSDALASDVRGVVERALQELERLGAELVPVQLPHSEFTVATYYVVATAEASSNLARFDGVRFGPRANGDGSLQGMFAATRGAGFGPEVRRRLLLGTYVLSSGYYDAWYAQAMKVRRLVQRDFEAAFEQVDVLAGPTNPTAAFALGERTDDPVAMYLSDVLTLPLNLAGLPGLSIPCGSVRAESASGASELPVGMQLSGPALSDARLLRIARVFQQHSAHHTRTPAAATAEVQAR